MEQELKNGIQDLEIKAIKESIKTLNDHSGEITKDVNTIKIDIKEVKTDVSWLKRFFWITATSAIGAVITSVMNLLK